MVFVYLQTAEYQLFQLVVDLGFLRYQDLLFGHFLYEHCVAFIDGEGEFSEDELEQDDADGPDVALFVVGLIEEDLGGHGNGGAAIGLHHELLIVKLPCESKVSQLDSEVLFEQNVGQFYIPVGDALRVQMVDRLSYAGDYLFHVVRLQQNLDVLLQILFEITLLAVLEDEVVVIGGLQCLVQGHYVGVRNALDYQYFLGDHFLLLLAH